MNEELTFKLKDFEGPLDLLLYLITKHKLNIYDIEISSLLEQYLAYIDNAEDTDLETAGEFLEMAARLIYIKTVSLLPKPEEAQELKKELEGRLIEYSMCKMAAKMLSEKYIGGESFVREPMKLPVDKTYNVIHSPQVLREAYMGIFARAQRTKPIKAAVFEPIVSRRIVSVTSRIMYIMKTLYSTGSCKMDRLYDGLTDKSERVATFLAVLELTKSGRIRLSDDNSVLYFADARKRAIAVEDQPPQEENVPKSGKKSAAPKVNLWNNSAIRHYTVAQGTLRKANLWGYLRKANTYADR